MVGLRGIVLRGENQSVDLPERARGGVDGWWGGLIFSLAVFFPEVGEVASRGVWEGGRGAM